jgi:hypothetical protein
VETQGRGEHHASSEHSATIRRIVTLADGPGQEEKADEIENAVPGVIGVHLNKVFGVHLNKVLKIYRKSTVFGLNLVVCLKQFVALQVMV